MKMSVMIMKNTNRFRVKLDSTLHSAYIRSYVDTQHNCDGLWENLPVTHKDNYLEKRN